MKEQFDKKLADKIRESFEHFEEPYDPAQWEKLSKAYFKPKKTPLRFIWPFITAGLAASLFLVLFFWPYGEDFVREHEVATDSTKRRPVTEDPVQAVEDSPEKDNIASPQPFAEESDLQEAKGPSQAATPASQRGTPAVPSSEKTIASIATIIREVPSADLKKSLEGETTSATTSDEIQLNGGLAESADSVVHMPESGEKRMDLNEALQVLEQWMAAGGEQQSTPAVAKSTAPIKLGVLVAPQASSDAVNGMNLGAGVMSEFSLSRKLRLDVGMTYARQTLSPDMPPSIAIAAEANYAKVDQMAMANNIRSSSNFVGSSSQLSLASIDIPVNVKYLLLESKNTGLFLITGLSSVVYLDQAATETFETNSFFTSTAGGLNFAPSVEQFTSVYRPEGNGRADIGGMLNLSVGYEYNLKNGMFISLEPFYKLPLGDLTFVNQQFSVAGMNLRMNFNLRK